MKELDFLEDYIESIVGNKVTIISGIEESEEYYKESGRLEAEREGMNRKFTYTKGNNDAYINAKENFLEELEKLKEYYSYE